MPQSGHSKSTWAGGAPVSDDLRASRSIELCGGRVGLCEGCGQYACWRIYAARLRIWGIGELEKELKRSSPLRTSVRLMPSGSMYSYGSNGFCTLRLGVVDRPRLGTASFGCAGGLVEWFRCEETFCASGRRGWDGLNGERALLIIDRHCLHVYGVRMLWCWPPIEVRPVLHDALIIVESSPHAKQCRRRRILKPRGSSNNSPTCEV
jgi:hypothetical protein